MCIDKLVPINFKSWDILNKANDLVFYDVHFTKEFGPWRDQEYCNTIQFLISEGRLVELTQTGHELKSIEVALTFIPAKPKEVRPAATSGAIIVAPAKTQKIEQTGV
jgi:hypothetical protein